MTKIQIQAGATTVANPVVSLAQLQQAQRARAYQARIEQYHQKHQCVALNS